MAEARITAASLRRDRSDLNRLLIAFVVSLLLHGSGAGGYYAGKRLGWWQHLRLPAWMESRHLLSSFLKKPPKPDPIREVPLMFVEVNPVQAVAEPPKNAKFYSDKNSVAANPNAEKETDIPKIEGKQEHVVKTETVPKEEFLPLQPVAPVEPVKPSPPEPEPKPAPPEKKGDLALGTPKVEPRTEVPPRQTRPRTLQEAMARQPNKIIGEKMRQDGGVKRRLELASLDAKATPFGAYDHALVEAISRRWFTLLDQRDYASDSRGKVVVNFRLYPDGSVQATAVTENTTTSEVLGIICRKAIEDPAPFPAWPSDMKRMLGDTRRIQFTFYYN